MNLQQPFIVPWMGFAPGAAAAAAAGQTSAVVQQQQPQQQTQQQQHQQQHHIAAVSQAGKLVTIPPQISSSPQIFPSTGVNPPQAAAAAYPGLTTPQNSTAAATAALQPYLQYANGAALGTPVSGVAAVAPHQQHPAAAAVPYLGAAAAAAAHQSAPLPKLFMPSGTKVR